MSGLALGISADYHDAAAALVDGGTVVAAAAEERFSRKKHDPGLPTQAVRYCLDEVNCGPGDLASVTFYSKPLTTYERILSTHAGAGPRGFRSLRRAIATWTRSKLWIGYRIERMLAQVGPGAPRVGYADHHQSHAAAAFYPSPFEHAAILTFDGLGEWATSSIAWGAQHRIEPRLELWFPDSLGLFYSAMTAFCGFAVNDGEYKLMGLAPFGEPRYETVLRENVIHVAEDGSVRLDQRWFDYRAGQRMTHPRLEQLLQGPPRLPSEPLEDREADIACSAQRILESSVLGMANHAHRLTGERNAALAGGVALNCVANARLLEEGPFDRVWVQPAAGDDGSAIGAALWKWHNIDDHPRKPDSPDGMSGARLGPAFSSEQVATWLDDEGIAHTMYAEPDDLWEVVSEAIAAGAVVGLFRGRMEFGPRALGGRSILADPRDPTMVERLNRRIKGREGFRPLAPAVLAERAGEWFEIDGPSPYMTFTARVRGFKPDDGPRSERPYSERLAAVDSPLPACTHVDGTARLQTVDRSTTPDFHGLLSSFESLTGCPVLVNTSFNQRDEPIVRTPAEAFRCFIKTGLDLLVLETCLVRRTATDGAMVGAAQDRPAVT